MVFVKCFDKKMVRVASKRVQLWKKKQAALHLDSYEINRKRLWSQIFFI